MRFFAIALAAAGCTFNWTDDQAAFPVEGEPPSLSSFTKLNTAPAGLASLMTGRDDAPWTVFCEFWGVSGFAATQRTCKKMHLVRLDDVVDDETIAADSFVVTPGNLYVIDDRMDGRRALTMHRPGDPADADVTFLVPTGRAVLVADRDGDAFAYWVTDAVALTFNVYRREPRALRSIPRPIVQQSADASLPDLRFFTDGKVLIVHDPDGLVRAYSTSDDGEVYLGQWRDVALDDDRHRVVVAGAWAAFGEGSAQVASYALDGSAVQLYGGAVDPGTLRVAGGFAWWSTQGGLWRAPLDGGAAELVQPEAARLLALGPRGEVTYSRDPGDRYAGGAGDGWLGDLRFMDRGRVLRWSGDGARVRFLEHAASIGTWGDLTSVTVADGAPTVLGINVHQFAETDDGRVLAVENRVYAGAWNRLVVIDEGARTKDWVVPSATEFLLIPGRNEVIADVVTGASGYDIVRAPIPGSSGERK